MKRIISIVLTALILGAGIAQAQKRTVTIDPRNANNSHTEQILNDIKMLGSALITINNNYIDTIDSKKMVDSALEGFVKTLDPHSTYIPADKVQEANESLDGSFEGVGIEFAIISDTLTVQNVISGGPSEAVGLHIGDKIIAIDGENVASVNLTNDDVRGKLRGPKGSKVKVRVIRHGVAEPLDFEIVRNKIPIESIDAAYQDESGVFYVKLGRFAAKSYTEFLKAFINHCPEEPKGLILDLRGNGGGFLNVALRIANAFLEEGQTILYTEGLNQPEVAQFADGKGFFRTRPLVLLVDENSASASEIVAGAIQDWDRGVIIGRRTFGKGLVQRQMNLENGAQMRLTIARYHTPSGRVIQTPYKEGEKDEYYKKLTDRYKSGEFFSIDSLSFPDSLLFHTRIQERPVYGGGGIMPDIFIPEDTTAFTPYYGSLIRRGILSEYVNIYCDGMRSQASELFPDFDAFYAWYTPDVERAIIRDLVEYASGKGLEFNDDELKTSFPALKPRLKGLIARTFFGVNEYYRVINRECDPEFSKAVEVILNWNPNLPSIGR
ncbi:MAG: PDZ domain-containing protein [Bacteroidales bacterium]|nr:PDZ domain-containing protein [Bacteroidales bacterium]